MIKENLSMKGNVKAFLIKEDNSVEEIQVNNLVVKTGTDFVASRMAGTSTPVMSHMAIGEGTSAPIEANATLQSEVGRVSLDSTNVNESDITYTATFPQGTGTGSIAEAGLFNDVSTGSMLSRTTFDVINKGTNDSIVLVWTISALSG